MAPKLKDISGKKFNRLTVNNKSNFTGNGKQKVTYWDCLCDCGNTTRVAGSHLKTGKIKSCGCYKQEQDILLNTTHNMSRTREYKSWSSMLERCTNKNHIGYKYYGGNGISVCKEWMESFENFYTDMGNRPENTSLDRKDGTKNYCKDNCRWVNQSIQSYNQKLADNNTSGIKGVGWHKPLNKWRAFITKNNKRIHLGYFTNLNEAALARKEAENKYFPKI